MDDAGDLKPTRRRSLLLPLSPDGKEWQLALVGPCPGARESLFKRLNQEAVIRKRVNDEELVDEGRFQLGGVDVMLFNWPEGGDEHVGKRYLASAQFALCVDPFDETPSQERMEPFLRRFRDGAWAPYCVVLVADDEHLPDSVEDKWEAYLLRQQINTTIYRVNCADTMSAEFFAKVFLAGVSDQGRSASSIEVREIEGGSSD